MGNSSSKKAKEVLPGVFWIDGHLEQEDQLNIFAATQELTTRSGSEFKNAGSNYSEFLSVDLKNIDNNTTSSQFKKILSSVENIIGAETFAFPNAEEFTYLTGYNYPLTGKLAGHTDNIVGWLVIVALGSSAKFWVQNKENKRKDIIFKSGDIMVFETSTEACIYHGIDCIIPNSSPKFFPTEFQDQRISLQFRQTITPQVSLSSLSLNSPKLSSGSDSFDSFDSFDSSPKSKSSLDNNNNNNNNNNNLPPPLTHPTPDAPFTQISFYGLINDTILYIFSFLDAPGLTLATATCKTYSQLPVSPFYSRIYQNILRKEREERQEKYNKRKNSRNPHDFFFSIEPGFKNFNPTLSSITPYKMTKALHNPIRKESNTTAVNIDLGTCEIRAGFCGDDDSPVAVVPTLWGKDSAGLTYVGEQCKQQPNLQLSSPIKNRVVEEFDQMKHIWEHIFVEKLCLLPPEVYILAQTGKPYPAANREKLTEMAFESLGAAGFYLSLNGILAIIACGETTGFSIDVGYESTALSISIDGFSEPQWLKTIDIGGYHITQHFKYLATQRYPDISFSDEEFDQIKRSICYIKTTDSKDKGPETYKGYTFDKERFQAAEILFHPKLWNVTANLPSLPSAVVSHLFTSVEMPDRAQFYPNFTLMGGGAMLPGMTERLQSELVDSLPKNAKVIISSPGTIKHAAWLGGTILGSLSTFSKMWISKPEYNESGPNIVHRKCNYN